jgi:hypothetical protein
MESVSLASERFGYSRDYITKLARDKKILATQIGRQWFVDFASLETYTQKSALEQKVRQQELSTTRKVEREIILQNQKNVSLASPYQTRLLRQKSALAMMFILGVAATYTLIHFSSMTSPLGMQVASSPLIPEFKNADEVYDVAVLNNVATIDQAPLAVDFSKESVRFSSLENFDNGILLLPYSAGTTTSTKPQDLFSDDVKILTDEAGQTYVARVNKQNQVVAEIPFVLVPVNSNQTTP